MTDLKPEDLVKLREIAEKAQAACPNWHHIGMSDPFAIYVNAFRPELVLSLLADRARMEKALDHALAALVNVTVNWGSTPDDDDAEGWCRQADTKRTVAQTALAQLGWGIDWNAIGRGEKDPAKLLKALGASQ